MSRSFLSVGALLLVGGACAYTGPRDMIGKSLPHFTLKDVDGKVWSNEALKGKAVVLDCWATWCGPCKAASATMDALTKKYGKRGLVVIALNKYDSPAKIAEYANAHHYAFPFAVDGATLHSRLGVVNLPTIFVLGRSGKIQSVMTEWNKTSPAQFEKLVLAALK